MSISVPTSRNFRGPLLMILASQSKNTPGKLIPVTDKLYRHVIREAGYNPTKLKIYGPPEQGWCFSGISKPPGLRRKVNIAYREMHRLKKPLVVQGVRGFWALTEAGVRRAQVLEEEKRNRPNVTAKFLEKRIKETDGGLLQLMRQHIAMKMPGSVAASLVDDHVQNCLMRLISRDSLRSRILLGFPVMDHHIASWAVNSAYVDIRNEGTEPLSRERYGNRTEKERKQGCPSETAVQGTGTENIVVFNETGELMDVVPSADKIESSEAEDQTVFRILWSKLLDTVRDKVQDDQFQVMTLRAEGHTLQEIATQMGLSKSSVTKALSVVRDTARSTMLEDDAPGRSQMFSWNRCVFAEIAFERVFSGE